MKGAGIGHPLWLRRAPWFNSSPNVPLAISEPVSPGEPMQGNDGWEPVVADPKPTAEQWGPPENKYPLPTVGLTPTIS